MVASPVAVFDATWLGIGLLVVLVPDQTLADVSSRTLLA